MIEKGDSVLVQERKGIWPGVAFPGGHVNEGEAFCDSVVREIYEETGLKLNRVELCGIKSWCENDERYCILIFRSDDFSGQLKGSEEGKVFWARKDGLKDLPLSKGMEDLIELYQKGYNEIYYRKTGEKWTTELK